ncbi:MAG: carbohydrate kinase, partial [Micrococcales bacterium]
MGPPQAGVLVIGESLVDIVTTADGQTSEHVGGSPANVALTLARLGTDAHLLTTTGNDERGRRIRDHLTGNGVRLIPGGPTETPTSTAAATLASGGHASYEFDLAWRVPDAVLGAVMGRLADFSCVHTGSVATVLKPGAGQVTQALSAAREHATVSYDPNIRPAIMDDAQTVRPQVEHIITMSDVVKCSDEDAQWLYPRLDLDELAGRWLGLGASIVVVTRGPRGATAWSGPDRLDVPGKTLQVADTIGA